MIRGGLPIIWVVRRPPARSHDEGPGGGLLARSCIVVGPSTSRIVEPGRRGPSSRRMRVRRAGSAPPSRHGLGVQLVTGDRGAGAFLRYLGFGLNALRRIGASMG